MLSPNSWVWALIENTNTTSSEMVGSVFSVFSALSHSGVGVEHVWVRPGLANDTVSWLWLWLWPWLWRWLVAGLENALERVGGGGGGRSVPISISCSAIGALVQSGACGEVHHVIGLGCVCEQVEVAGVSQETIWGGPEEDNTSTCDDLKDGVNIYWNCQKWTLLYYE